MKQTGDPLTQLGFIRGAALDDLKRWMQAEPLTKAAGYASAPDRLEAWYGLGSNLAIDRKERVVLEAPLPPERICQLGSRLFNGWDSLLLCGGNTYISWHRDHGHFEASAVMVNIGEAVFSMKVPGVFPAKEEIVEWYLTDGQVVRIDTKLLHCAKPVTPGRMSLTFRKVKEDHLPISRRSLFASVLAPVG